MADHTPTPWYMTNRYEIGPRIESDDQSDGMHEPVMDVWVGENRAADAAFILNAVNSHDALVAALRDMVDHFKPFRLKPIGGPGSAARLDQEMQISVHNTARAVLKASTLPSHNGKTP